MSIIFEENRQMLREVNLIKIIWNKFHVNTCGKNKCVDECYENSDMKD